MQSIDQALSSDPSSLRSLRGRVLGVDHFTIPVRDMALAERFYIGLLGAELVMRVDEELLSRIGGPLPPERRAELQGPNTPIHTSIRFGEGPRIDLFLQTAHRPTLSPHPHFAFGVRPEELVSLRAVLEQAGVPTDGPRRLGPPGQASLYFNDPFGNHLELTTMSFFDPIPVGAPDMSRLDYEWRG